MWMKTTLAILGMALAMAGCASFKNPGSLAPGSDVATMRSTLGTPTGQYTVAGGTRYEYATGPFGKFTWMMDFDEAGRLKSATQVLTEARFNAIRAGMDAKDLRATLGRPSDTWELRRLSHVIWQYRYDSPFCQLFQVSVGADGKVVDTGYAPDPVCESLDSDRSFN
jgi:hypothetical protein